MYRIVSHGGAGPLPVMARAFHPESEDFSGNPAPYRWDGRQRPDRELGSDLCYAFDFSDATAPDPGFEEFDRGYVIACCNLVNLHDQPGMAWDVLSQLGVSRADVKRMDLSEYDMKALRVIEKDSRTSPYGDGRTQKRLKK